MNREETLKKFNTYSSLFLVLGILDLAEFWQQGYDRSAPRRRFSCGFSPEDFIPGDCSSWRHSGSAEILCWDPGIATGQGQCKGRPSSEGRPGYDDPVDDLPGVVPAYDTQGRRRCLRRPAGSGCCDFSGTVCKVREDTDDNEIATGFHNQTDLRDSFEDHITPHFSCLFFVALKQTLMTSRL